MGSGDTGSGFTANGFKILSFFETFGEFSALDSRGGVGRAVIILELMRFGASAVTPVFAVMFSSAGLKDDDSKCPSVGDPSTIPLI